MRLVEARRLPREGKHSKIGGRKEGKTEKSANKAYTAVDGIEDQ